MTPRRGGYMSGPVPEKTIAWLRGALCGGGLVALVWLIVALRGGS